MYVKTADRIRDEQVRAQTAVFKQKMNVVNIDIPVPKMLA
jgi:hypothetical protein